MNKKLVVALAGLASLYAAHACGADMHTPFAHFRQVITDEVMTAVAAKHGLLLQTVCAAHYRYKKRMGAVDAFTNASKGEIEAAAQRYRLLRMNDRARKKNNQAELAAIPRQTLQALADRHELPLEIVRIALLNYKRQSKNAADFMVATKQEIEKVARDHESNQLEYFRHRAKARRAALGAIPDEVLTALAREREVELGLVHTALLDYKRRVQSVDTFMEATTQDLLAAQQRYKSWLRDCTQRPRERRGRPRAEAGGPMVDIRTQADRVAASREAAVP